MVIVKNWCWVGMGLALLVAHGVATALEKIVPSELAKPTVCPDYFKLDGSSGKCVAKPDDVPNATAEVCQALGFTLGKRRDNSAACTDAKQTTLGPTCKSLAGYGAKISGSGVDATCSYEPMLPSSAAGDYIGDCFQIKAIPPGSGLVFDQDYFVTGQKNIDGEDRELTLVPGEIWLLPRLKQWIPHWGCQAVGGEAPKPIAASKLIEAGAIRKGYAFGFLTMPYKYFPSEKSFEVNVPIGGYLGWRTGQAGSGITWAAAATLSTVKANTVDPTTLDAAGKPTVTGTANVAALSGAVGAMFDVLKSPRGKPFKAGIFVGQDVVSKDPTIDYRFNRKTWIAIQLGYDFTDN